MKQIFEIEWGLGKLNSNTIRKALYRYLNNGYYTCAGFPQFCVGRGGNIVQLAVGEVKDGSGLNGARKADSERSFDKMVSMYVHGVEEERKRREETKEDYEKMLSKVDDNGLISVLNDIGDRYLYHKTAIIDKALIGAGTKIWHYSHICDGASIGMNCTIGQNVYIGPKVKIGNNCKIQNNVYIPEGVEIKSCVFIGPSVTFTNVKYPDASISQKNNFKQTFVRNNVTIGANATIICGVGIGRSSIVGAGAVVTKSVKDCIVVAGNPAEWKGDI